MIKNTIAQIEEKLKANSSLSEENKAELLSMLGKLNAELTEFSKEQGEHAEKILGHIERSADELNKDEKDEGVIKNAVESLSDSVRGFEVSHPKLVEQINFIATKLANSGI